VLTGGAGDDLLYGGGSGVADTLIGGTGNDTFSGTAEDLNLDIIADFTVADSIVVVATDLSALHGSATSSTIDLGGSYSLTLNGITPSSGTFSAVFSGGNTT